jgi:hypothetical protein
MTDAGADVTPAEGAPTAEPVGKATGTGQGSRLERYRHRIEEWASVLRDEAEQHAPRRCSAAWRRPRGTSLDTSMAWQKEPG